jgi:GDP-L-fucose synthase
MKADAKIFVAGHRGLVGSAILRKLKRQGYRNLLFRRHQELDLTRQAEVEAFFAGERPEFVFLAAARVGGIYANSTFPAEFIHENLAIQTHVMHAAYLFKVKKLLFLGSSCIYPKFCPQPIQEENLMSGPLEPTNAAYAVAKIAGIEMCWGYNQQYGTQFIPVMPTNIYGPNDNFDLKTSHVLPALIRKCHLAKLSCEKKWNAIREDENRYGMIPDDMKTTLGLSADFQQNGDTRPKVGAWGSGSPRREFLHVDDLADACVFIMRKNEMADPDANRSVLFNIGAGKDLTIRQLAEMIADIVGYEGDVAWNANMPDGTPRKLLDVSRMGALGWKPKIGLKEGIRRTYDWYLETLKAEN